MITPKEARKSLTIPASTLRRWSNEFADHLSPHEKGSHRSYTTTDLDVLFKIKKHLDDGLKYDEIHKRLNAIEKPSEEASALMIIGTLTEELENQRSLMQSLNNKISKQDERLDQLEEWLTLPPLKRLFTKPPKRKDQE